MSSTLPTREAIETDLAAGNLPHALASSEALLASDPANPEVLTLRAAVLMASDKTDAAVELLQRARANGAEPGIDGILAMCQVAAGDLGAAIGTFRSALAARPDDFPLRLAYAETLDARGEGDDALPEYLRAVNVAQRHGRWLSDESTGPAMRERVKRAIDIIDGGRAALFHGFLQPHLDAFGADSLARVAHALDIYLGAPRPEGSDPRQQPKFLWVPGLPATPLFEHAQFPWQDALEAETPGIRDELMAVLGGQAPLTPFLDLDDTGADNEYLGGNPHSRAWDAYFFHRHGERFAEAHAACPLTSRALDATPLTRIAEHAPEVLFSLLEPQTHIKPHHGVTNTRVVTHLPLLIPDGDCRLVVGGIEHAWQEGRCVTFDDTFLHEAWNRTDARRAVLILDTWNPYLAPEECVALKDLIERIGHFNQRADVT